MALPATHASAAVRVEPRDHVAAEQSTGTHRPRRDQMTKTNAALACRATSLAAWSQRSDAASEGLTAVGRYGPVAMTEATFTTATRAACDGVATVYTDHVAGALDDQPLDRAMLTAFAEMVGSAGSSVLDVGCGPGYVTAFVSSLGVDIAGVDLSPTMVALARERHPRLMFEVGSMADLGRPDASVAGVIGWYSFIHIPPDQLAAVMCEIRRVLAPGGYLLLACHGTETTGEATCVFDHAVLPAYRWSPDHLSDLLRGNAMQELARISRRPSNGERFPQVRILARRQELSCRGQRVRIANGGSGSTAVDHDGVCVLGRPAWER
jgi:SAM-dependent methyltransferase